MKGVARLIAVTGSTVLALALAGTAMAQESAATTGVVVRVETSAAGELSRFAVLDSSGQVTEFSVGGATEYGLDNEAGDRWVATQGDEPVEAARRLRDHQARFAPVTVQSENGVASLVVEYEKSDLESNLGFLFAAFAVAWGFVFVYIFFMTRKQRELQRELARLRGASGQTEDA